MEIERTAVVEAPPEALAANLAAAAIAGGLKTESPVPGAMTLSRRYLRGSVLVFALAVIGMGVVLGAFGAGPVVWLPVAFGVLLLWLGRTSEQVTLVMSPSNGGTVVAATGSATGPLADFVDGVYEAV